MGGKAHTRTPDEVSCFPVPAWILIICRTVCFVSACSWVAYWLPFESDRLARRFPDPARTRPVRTSARDRRRRSRDATRIRTAPTSPDPVRAWFVLLAARERSTPKARARFLLDGGASQSCAGAAGDMALKMLEGIDGMGGWLFGRAGNRAAVARHDVRLRVNLG